MTTQATNLGANLAHLPQSVRDLIHVIGITATVALVQARGGTCITVPTDPRPDHWLATIIGYPALQALATVYARETLDIPRCDRALRAAREAQILADADAGHSVNDLALRHGCTRQTIANIRRRHYRQPQQAKLF